MKRYEKPLASSLASQLATKAREVPKTGLNPKQRLAAEDYESRIRQPTLENENAQRLAD